MAPEFVKWVSSDHTRPCVALDKSPFFPGVLLSVGDWSFQIWKVKVNETNKQETVVWAGVWVGESMVAERVWSLGSLPQEALQVNITTHVERLSAHGVTCAHYTSLSLLSLSLSLSLMIQPISVKKTHYCRWTPSLETIPAPPTEQAAQTLSRALFAL